MPQNEIEFHPFLSMQLNSNDFNFHTISTLIIGTFPVYEITTSEPTTTIGLIKKEEWINNAFFKYFYGSRKNNFWNILCNCIGAPFPNNINDCISILNHNGIFLSDTIVSTYRNEFDPSDISLNPIDFNVSLVEQINQFSFHSLNNICFTSDLAKKQFCEIMHINDEGRNQQIFVNNKTILLNTLPTPAGNGRTVTHFFNTYPLSTREFQLRRDNLSYALEYRKRVYCETIFR
jgi:hypothetical protein